MAQCGAEQRDPEVEGQRHPAAPCRQQQVRIFSCSVRVRLVVASRARGATLQLVVAQLNSVAAFHWLVLNVQYNTCSDGSDAAHPAFSNMRSGTQHCACVCCQHTRQATPPRQHATLSLSLSINAHDCTVWPTCRGCSPAAAAAAGACRGQLHQPQPAHG